MVSMNGHVATKMRSRMQSQMGRGIRQNLGQLKTEGKGWAQ